MAIRKERKEIQHMFKSLDPKSQQIAVHIAQKFGRRFAYRYIVRVSAEQPSSVVTLQQPGFFAKIFHRIRKGLQALFISDDSEGESISSTIPV